MEMRKLSPLRSSTSATSVPALATEQLQHFGIDPATPFGQSLQRISERLYGCASDLEQLWAITMEASQTLDRADRV
ncbi:MAG: Cys/Met metabolism pyridoxal-phosphate-dependent enzyme, partial [Proteobacteria bacterium]|nr:Cys/Met metabolism pyridoxal-phosphate-dependent enzyme [Pseudomonadota bacterium]